MHSIKYQSTALLQKLLHRGIVMLWTHYKEYFKTAFYDVLEWREDTDRKNSNGPGVSASFCFNISVLSACAVLSMQLSQTEAAQNIWPQRQLWGGQCAISQCTGSVWTFVLA